MTDDQGLRELEEKYEDYKVYDNAGEKIGKVDDLFVDEADREEYIGVKMGLFGLSGTTLIPMEIARVNERDKTIEVSESKDRVKDSPKFSDDDEITPEYEDRIRRHFGLESHELSTERGSYGRYAGSGAGRATEGATLAEGGMPRDERDAEDRDPASTMSGDEARERMDRESYEDRDRTEDEGYRREGSPSEPGVRGDLGPSGSELGEPAREGMTRGDEESRTSDESYREGLREGFREGYHEGLRESRGRDEGYADRAGSAEGTERSGMPTDHSEEYRGTPQRSDEGEESGVARVWRRVRR
ncbi:MAG: PRC-barrel domain-containing protein [Actinomycetota bacterium]|nr:PRC-barrel domain-containing protein [Actinomycetota bacterium]